MNYDIIKLLNFNPDEIIVTDITVDEQSGTRFIHIEAPIKPVYCPICGFRMHSKGRIVRHVNYPIF